MTKTMMIRLALCLAASPLAVAQNADRQLQSVTLNQNTLEIATSDGRYLIKPYSANIVCSSKSAQQLARRALELTPADDERATAK